MKRKMKLQMTMVMMVAVLCGIAQGEILVDQSYDELNVNNVMGAHTTRDVGQSFTPTADNITNVELYLVRYKMYEAGGRDFDVKLYATDVDGWPTGTALASASMNTYDIPDTETGGTYDWYTFDFGGVAVTPGQQYAWMIEIDDAAPTGNINVAADDSGLYPGGNEIQTGLQRETWDMMFKTHSWMPVLVTDEFLPPYDNVMGAHATRDVGQSFTATNDRLERIDLYLLRTKMYETGGRDFDLKVYETDPNGWPAGTALATATRNTYDIMNSDDGGNYAWYDFTFDAIDLIPGQQYAWMIEIDDAAPVGTINVAANTAGTYLGGNEIQTGLQRTTWDMMFKLYRYDPNAVLEIAYDNISDIDQVMGAHATRDVGQSFTAGYDNVQRVDLYLVRYKMYEVGGRPFYVRLYATDVDGWPTGDALASASMNTYDIPDTVTGGTYAWYSFYFDAPLLVPGRKYAAMIEIDNDAPTGNINLAADSTGTYVGGNEIQTGLQRTTWDMMFRVYSVPGTLSYPVTGGRVMALAGDSIAEALSNTLYQFWDDDADGASTILLDMQTSKNVSTVEIVNRLDGDSVLNAVDVEIYTADESDPCFAPYDVTDYTQVVYTGQFLPASSYAGVTRSADFDAVTKRYLLLKFTSTFRGPLAVPYNHVQVDDVDAKGIDEIIVNCEAVRDYHLTVEADLDRNCYVGDSDMIVMADQWLSCTEPGVEGCVEQEIRTVYAILPGTVTVDADLSEWTDAVWFDLDQVYHGNPNDVVSARFALKWNEDTDRIYAAVVVDDADHIFLNYPTDWDDSDRIEVYAQGDPNGGIDWGSQDSEMFDKAQQYVTGPKVTAGSAWAYWGGGDAIEVSAGFQYAADVVGSEIIYEIGAKMFVWFDGRGTGVDTVVAQLEAGSEVGFDIVADTRWADDGFGMLSENLMAGKYYDAGQFQLYTLAEAWPDLYCGDWGYLTADINGDCQVDLSDFADLAGDWFYCNDPQNDGCVKNW